MSPSLYPGGIDATSSTFPVRADGTTTATQHKDDHNNLADAVIKVESELGTNPRGAYATVKDRLVGLNRVGTLATRGTASAYTGGRYFATDLAAEYVSDGTSWIRVSAPAGELVSFPGMTLPPSLVRCHGQALSRTGIYAEAFAALTVTAVASADGTSTLTISAGVPESVGVGHKVEGLSITGSRIVTAVGATTVTLDGTVASGAGSVRFFAHGNGNASTTFTLPDARGKSAFGRDNMGGTLVADANYHTGSVMGAVGGKVTHLLSINEAGVGAHAHPLAKTAQDQGHSHIVNSHSHGGVTGAAGSHAHTMAANGNHTHATSSFYIATDGATVATGGTGSSRFTNTGYSNSIAQAGSHDHQIYAVADHTHGIAAEQPGTNVSGVHTHEFTTPQHTGTAASLPHENRSPFLITDQCIRL